ncbi:LysM peptidoglycan-binding domain-containing protein [Acinetobacter sp. WZC-1]|uniref:LysM peptidoglycan-binding domain-containing protein n=1 Tax=Acinetobacter sp. WZC-1 TaxID=3459034 RepID=UPI00403D739E
MYKTTTAVWQPSAAILFKFSILTSALAAFGLMTGCSSSQSASKPHSSKQLGMLDANSLDSLEDLLSATDMRAVEGDRLLILKHGDVWKRMAVGFKMDEDHWDPRIEAQRSWFVSRQPYIDRLSARASRYLYHTVKEAERRGLPTELALLPIIESSYDPAATSSASAAGMWQFIPSTGRIYGLRQSGLYDGRRDVVESTRAAYEFLGSLYNQFGSWELALAAYNAGPGRIQQAINRNQAAGLPTDYWSLKLPQETMNYVPRFIAVAQIIKKPQQYGISLPPIANRPHFREVSVPAGVQFNQIASLTGLSRAELYALNPGYRGEIVDPASPMRILIPADLKPTIDAKLKALKPASGGFWASSTTPATPQQPAVSTTVTKVTPTRTPPPTLTAGNTTVSRTPAASTFAHRTTPKGSDALAAFAANADIPSAPRIPVAVTQAAGVKKPVAVEPPISSREREQILAAVKAEGEQETVRQVLEPQATQAEKDEVIKEIQAIAPQGTEIVDPYDGKIKLTAIQTSRSVADQQGQDVSLGFAYPKGMVDSTSATSEEARLNQGKTLTKTENEVVVAPPKGKRSTYTVLPGDTLAIIAMKNGVNWRDIAKWNQVDPKGTLFVGATLYLYDARPKATDSAAAKEEKPVSYTVRSGDSLTSVAAQSGLSVAQLAAYNNLSVTSNLLAGQKLALTDTDSGSKSNSLNAREQKQRTASDSKVKTRVYAVKRGEYLKLIADRYALSNQELAALTPGISAGSNLQVGQKINVPLQDVNVTETDLQKGSKAEDAKAAVTAKTENYRVQRGDTLSSVAARSKISVSELAALNKLSASRNLVSGQTIKIPAGSTVPDSYTVQSGDSLIGIAGKYNLPLSQLANLNGLSPSAGLFVGQKLKLTGEAELSAKSSATTGQQLDVHVVKSGETVAGIARKYRLQQSYLRDLNGLSRNATVRAGQRLKIEGDVVAADTEQSKAAATAKAAAVSTKNTEKYVVKSGESLNLLASRAGMTVQELATLNNISARTGLKRGQSIIMPKTVTEYKVKSGDSLIRLASKFGLNSNELAEMNELKPGTQLRIGDVIKVPNL